MIGGKMIGSISRSRIQLDRVDILWPLRAISFIADTRIWFNIIQYFR